ncbi:ABC transporter permease [Selenomonas dianae]|uniref:ABC transporter permease n=1 Tax=Selenomonas dianae TaxID=135079 RepID=A0ABP3CKW2_9FIRM|nr:ABC transporter permease [Selenomonas dianae]WLD81813.1 ABC transporter permease [Selenomonas dianae]
MMNFFLHTPPLFRLLALLAALILIVSLFSAQLAPYDPYATDPQLILKAPSAEHLLGTDNYGRDILSRILAGGKTSIFAALFIILIAGSLGSFIGLLSGYYRGRMDAVLMRITDVFQAFPDIVLAIAVAGVLGGGLVNAVLALIVTTWTQYARIARSAAIAAREETYIQAARLSGCTDTSILFGHILPNIAGQLVVTAVLHVSTMMMGLAGLSYLGIGVQIPAAEWGAMISEGQKYLQQAPWAALAPSAMMVAVMMVFNMFGDQLRDLLDPKMREKRV